MADEDVLPNIDEAGGDEDPKAPPSSGRIIERASLVISIFTALAAVVAIIVQSVATANQFSQANDLAYSYQGAQQCSDYREQVIRLWELGLTAEQTKSWFAKETGGTLADSQKPGGSTRTAYDDRRDGCGSVESLLAELPKTPPSPAPKSG